MAGKYASTKECLEKNRDANLRGANLEGAKLEGAENYGNSHDFAFELIRRQALETFTDAEWAVIGQIAIHQFCWGTIRTSYPSVQGVLKKLAGLGWDKYLKLFEGKGDQEGRT